MKKCPFCGGEGEVFKIEDKYYSSRCKAAGCIDSMGYHYSKKEAIKTWNNRTLLRNRITKILLILDDARGNPLSVLRKRNGNIDWNKVERKIKEQG